MNLDGIILIYTGIALSIIWLHVQEGKNLGTAISLATIWPIELIKLGIDALMDRILVHWEKLWPETPCLLKPSETRPVYQS
jgi:hypothetical protein